MNVRDVSTSAPTGAGCMNPVRLRGFYQRINAQTGELLAMIGTPEQPDGVLLVACKDRRASRCAPCAKLYQRDAYQLLAAGLRGGKTVPASVGTHPAIMLTLTAPSFGAVHNTRDQGRACACGRKHTPDDPQVGTPLDPDHYRYDDQIIWNHHAPELWKRTVQGIRRGLAQALGVPRWKLRDVACVRFAKVAEFQRRGVVHYHAIVRIDGPVGAGSAPPAGCTSALLEHVVDAAATTTSAAAGTGRIRWGAQREVVPLDSQTCTAAASYIAKYATKATESTTDGILMRPVRSQRELNAVDLPDHARRLVIAAWITGERMAMPGLKRWAHQFGYGGHTLTKSHQYSITFAALRAARVNWHDEFQTREQIVVRAQLSYAGRGPTPQLILPPSRDPRQTEPRPGHS
jgi:hypothetical protein